MEHYHILVNSSVIRQKDESWNGCFKKTKHAKFSEKRTFLTPISFFEKFVVFCFLETPISRFADSPNELFLQICIRKNHFMKNYLHCCNLRIVLQTTCKLNNYFSFKYEFSHISRSGIFYKFQWGGCKLTISTKLSPILKS